jgi:hypothetical protein
MVDEDDDDDDVFIEERKNRADDEVIPLSRNVHKILTPLSHHFYTFVTAM